MVPTFKAELAQTRHVEGIHWRFACRALTRYRAFRLETLV
jgi:hypothetical protein